MSAQQFGNWKRQFLENASSAFEQPDTSEGAKQIAELERMVGRLTMQLEIAKKPSASYARPPAKMGNCHEITVGLLGD